MLNINTVGASTPTKQAANQRDSISSRSDNVVKKLEEQLAELKSSMSTRMDTELKNISESIAMLRSSKIPKVPTP